MLVVRGFRNNEIGDELQISEQTVKNLLHSAFKKLRVSDRLELALFAIYYQLQRALLMLCARSYGSHGRRGGCTLREEG